jgi:DNA-binding MarR family transcriptional regulator
MSRGAERSRAEMLRVLVREFRQSTELGASLWRAVASRMGMAVTDVQVLDLLQSIGPMTAGQIADNTGLTTGSTTSLLNRLEQAGLVRRERDPDDGRRVIVQLTSGADPLQAIAPTFDALSKALEDLTALTTMSTSRSSWRCSLVVMRARDKNWSDCRRPQNGRWTAPLLRWER